MYRVKDINMLSWPRAISSFCEMMSLSRDETTMKTSQTCARPTRLPVQEAPLALQISYPSQKLHSIGITSNKNQSGDWRPWCRVSTIVDQIFGGLVPASRSFMKPADSFSAFRKWWMVKWWNDWNGYHPNSRSHGRFIWSKIWRIPWIPQDVGWPLTNRRSAPHIFAAEFTRANEIRHCNWMRGDHTQNSTVSNWWHPIALALLWVRSQWSLSG